VAKAAVSLGISLNSCTLPGIGREDRVPAGKAELGLGIHGEPGVELIDFATAKQVADLITSILFKNVAKAKSYALLLNNLGGTTPLEMAVLANEILTHPKARTITHVVGPALLMTSLDMHGASASLLPLTPEFEKALRSNVAPQAWPAAQRIAKPKTRKLPKEIKLKPAKASANPALREIVEHACQVLIANEQHLNALDAKVGDGDTGSTIATAARNVLASLNALPLANTGKFYAALSAALTQSMGGSSGVLLAIFFAAAGTAASAGASWAKALQEGLNRMMEYGGAKPGDRTMIDALAPTLANLAAGTSIVAAAKAARQGANATAQMSRAKAGRSTYVSAENLAGINDPGAEAVARLLEGIAGK
jgi:dihydroxyacetone kinase